MLPLDCAAALSTPLFQQIVRVESAGNPFAIGVVGGQLTRQPKNLEEAVATVRSLVDAGRNFSIGLGQVNQLHFDRFGWRADPARGFDLCSNVTASASIYNECYSRARQHGYRETDAYGPTNAALSCYYSGDFVAGSRLGYVSKVLGVTASAPTHRGPSRTTSMMLFQDE